MISLESPDQGPENQARHDRTKRQIDRRGARQEPAGSRLGAALTGQLIRASRLASKLDANAPRRESIIQPIAYLGGVQ
jgi:hypothetical protein